jgi:hypothetical protein
MDFSGCPEDATFGPAVHNCNRRDFDFTLKFASIFFSILPAATFIILAFVRLIWLSRKPVIVKGRIFQLAKLVGTSVYMCLATEEWKSLSRLTDANLH